MSKSYAPFPTALAAGLLICALHQAQHASAQSFTIAQPNIVACGGYLYDSGGSSGAGYGLGEDFTATICPDQAGSSISLNFLLFSLSQSGMAPMDELSIYDGALAFAPLIGTFTGQELQDVVIVASQFNPSGCLTLRFRSNDAGGGNFAASIGCGQPCAAPVAILNTQQGATVTLCQGQELVLDGSSSFAMPDRQIMKWVWRNNGVPADTTLTPAFSFSNAQGGVNSITLQVVDDSGCPSEVSAPINALVSTSPAIAVSASSVVVCPGAVVELLGQGEPTPMVSTSAGCHALNNGSIIPDDVGIPFTSTMQLGSTAPGTILTDIAQLGDICLDMEHSYMGDLVVSLTCPNGQSVTLHQQGGGGTNLGIPGASFEQGECWTYCFSASPDHGTWTSSGAATLPPGTYASVQPLEQLLGCPLSGTWTLTILDLWASDDGYLCGWCIDHADPADSSFIALGPIPGSSPDSSFWVGAGLNNDPAVGGQAMAMPMDIGPQAYTYTVIDSYGCPYSASLTVDVSAPLSINAGPDIILCEGPEMIEAEILEGFVPQECAYTLRLYDSSGDGWSSGLFGTPAHVSLGLNGQSTSYSLGVGASGAFSIPLTPGASLSMQYFSGDNNFQNSFELRDDQGAVLYASPMDPVEGMHYSGVVSCNGGVSPTLLSWSPEAGLSDPSVLDPTVFTHTSAWYVLTASVAGELGCFVVDSVWVEAPDSGILPIFWESLDATLCTDPGFMEYAWYRENVLEFTTATPCIEEVLFGPWHVIATPAIGCVWSSLDTLLCPVISIVQNGGLLLSPAGLGSYVWTFQGNVVDGAEGPFLEVIADGLYTVTITTEYGCVISASKTVVGIVGLVESSNNGPGWIIFPNPNNGQFTVRASSNVSGPVHLSVMDLSGRSIVQGKVLVMSDDGRSMIDMDLAAGAYLVELRTSDSITVDRLVVR